MAEKKFRIHWLVRTIRKTGWAPASVFAFYVVAANVFNGYERFPALDMPTHFAGGLALAYFLVDAFDNVQDIVGPIPPPIRVLLTFTCVCTAAVCWEFYEFFCDHVLGTHMQFGRDDTMSDLFFGLAGGAAYLALRRVFGATTRSRKQSSVPKKKVG